MNGSSGPGEVVVAVAVCTPPLMALQRSITHATPLERSFRFILIFAGDAQAHRQLLRIPRGCESIILLVYRKTSAFRGWCCSIFCLLIVGVVRAVCLLDSSQLRCGKQLLTPDTASKIHILIYDMSNLAILNHQPSFHPPNPRVGPSQNFSRLGESLFAL